ncbi:MAG: archease [bacterium]|nr:archease [bacterium]
MTVYKEIEHTADIGVEIYGNSFEVLLQHAAYALFDTIADVSTIRPERSRSVQVSGADDESLLMNWLRELLFLFAVEEEVYAGIEIQSLRAGELRAIVKGETLDIKRHRFKTELKAVTYHQFKLEHTGNRWTARVIFDV